MKITRILKKIILLCVVLVLAYWVIATLIFGHRSYDDLTGKNTFYWSGLKALWTPEEDFGFKAHGIVNTRLEGIDGPYVLEGIVYHVTAENKLARSVLDTTRTILVQVNNKDQDTFRVKIMDTIKPGPAIYPMPEKLIALSDIEGNFNGFYSFLIENGVMDKDYRWTFGTGHLVLNGDFVDRGEHVTAVLWLIYHLEQQAIGAGGKLHYILGNHEILNMSGNASYAQHKYRELARQVSKQDDWDKATRYLYSEKSVIGKWLRTKHVMQKIGPYVFVHAGLNKVLTEEGLTLPKINAIAKQYYGRNPEADSLNRHEFLILKSNHSPYWDRTLSMSIFYKIQYFYRAPFKPIPTAQSQEDLEKVLSYYKASRMVIGHSIVGDIKTGYKKRVIKIDLKHGQEKFTGKTKGILIEKGQLFKVDDLGNKVKMSL